MNKNSPTLRIKARIGIEVGSRTGLNEASADLLEQIEATGSLSQAAKKLRYSYRWAWLLLDSVNHAWEKPLVITATGGKKGGGALLTPHGKSVLAAYRHLQIELEHFLDLQTQPLRRTLKISPRPAPPPTRKSVPKPR